MRSTQIVEPPLGFEPRLTDYLSLRGLTLPMTKDKGFSLQRPLPITRSCMISTSVKFGLVQPYCMVGFEGFEPPTI